MVVKVGTTAPKIAAIRALSEAGYTLIPLRGKSPFNDKWPEIAPGTYDENNLPGNYGVALKAGDLVVDVDPRHFVAGDQPLKRLIAAVGALKSFTVRSGAGGLHIYLRKPADTPIRCKHPDYPGIDFLSAGRQVVGPGSIHPDTGQEYAVASGNPTETAEAPTALLALLHRTEVPFDEIGTGTYINDAATQARFLAYLQDAAPATGSFLVACKGRDLGLPPGLVHELMLDVWNPRRASPKTPEELRVKVIHAYKYAKGAVGNAHPSVDFNVVMPKTPPKEKEPELAWNTSPQGKMQKTFNNLMNYLRLPAGGLHKVFAFNDFTGRVEFVNPAPWHKAMMPKTRAVSDHDLMLLRGFLASRHSYDATLGDIESAVTNVAYHDRFHPVREYLSSLTWDGNKRLDTWMRDYLGAVDGGHPDYLRAVSRKVLCAAVMRVMRPGIKFDHVLVLEGAQDLGKSTAVEILGGEWASDAPVDPHSRDTIGDMQGRWVIEMAEMEVLRKTEEEALKAFITRRTDRARLAYGRVTGEYPRQSIFIATKNPRADGTYLKDETGNRRWWPVRCDPSADLSGLAQVDFKGLKEARNQLFAEAYKAVTSAPGECLYMETADLKTQARKVVEQRHAEHEWTESVAVWLETLNSKPETKRDFLTAREVFIDALGGSDSRLNQGALRSIARVLRDLGWHPALRWRAGRPMRGYVFSPSVVDNPTAPPREKKNPLDNLLNQL